MPDILTDISPSSLATAIKANLYAFFQSLPSASQAADHDSSPGFCWQTAVAHPWFNGVLSTQPPRNGAGQVVQDTVDYFQSQAVPQARGQGIGSAMTLTALYDGRDLGYRAGVLQSSGMGYPVYQRLGFQKLCQMDYFYWLVRNRAGAG
jgi:GNAT superfamily N-acetyltransferase